LIPRAVTLTAPAMEIRIQPTSKNIVNTLLYLQASAIAFEVTDIGALATTLMSEIEDPKLTPQLLLNLGILQVIDHFPSGDPYDAFKNMAKTIQNLPPGTVVRTPSKAFKQFCGAAWLTSRGMISRSGALNHVKQHIQSRGLEKSETIILDDALKTALNTAADYIPSYTLETLIEGVFNSPL